MGLSNEERITGLYHAIDKMIIIADHLKEQKSYPDNHKLIFFINQLWHAFLGKNRNSMHWIFGSSASNEIKCDTATPWGVAINYHCNGILPDKDLPEKEDDTFDAFDGFIDIPGLLGQANPVCKDIYEIYAWTEQAIYYLRRYEDNFLKNFHTLSHVLSDIQGECFKLFKQDNTYAKAYVLHTIIKMIYGPLYPYQKDKWDVVTRFLQEDHGHHDISLMVQPEGNLKTLAELHVKLQQAKKANKLTKMMRIEAFLILAGRRFHYDHTFKKLIEMLKKDKGFKPEDFKRLEELFDQCKKEHEKSEKESQERYNDQYSPLSIYSYDYE
jgi:hypothetical protein